VIAVLLLAVGIVWGLAYAPADYQQGNSFRIMYVHVPAAIWSMGVHIGLPQIAPVTKAIKVNIAPIGAMAIIER